MSTRVDDFYAPLPRTRIPIPHNLVLFFFIHFFFIRRFFFILFVFQSPGPQICSFLFHSCFFFIQIILQI
jgi:hypothetical protein